MADLTVSANVDTMMGSADNAAIRSNIAVANINSINHPGGIATLVSGNPFPTTDQVGKSHIFYTPCIHNVITLYDGTNWIPVTFAEIDTTLSGLDTAKGYDAFGYLTAGALTIEHVAWTDLNNRATALAILDGRVCKTGDRTRLHLYSFAPTAATTTEDSGGGTASQVGGKRYLWNRYNSRDRIASVIDLTDSWSYTNVTIRAANGSANNSVKYFAGDSSTYISANQIASAYIQSNVAQICSTGIGIDSTTVMSGLVNGGLNNATTSGAFASTSGVYLGYPGLGLHTIYWLESGADGTCLFVGDNGGVAGIQSGLTVIIGSRS